MAEWKHDRDTGWWYTTDGRYIASKEHVPQSCEGPHPSPDGQGSDGTFCYGDWLHEADRWCLTEGGTLEDAGSGEIVLIRPTLRELKRYVDSGFVRE